jgi:hypothetical protein
MADGDDLTISSLIADGRPAEAMFPFDVPLESPSLLWLCFRGGGFEPFRPPAVGQAARFASTGGPYCPPPGQGWP